MLNWRLGGAQCRSGGFGEQKYLLTTLGFEPTTVERVAYLLTELSWLILYN